MMLATTGPRLLPPPPARASCCGRRSLLLGAASPLQITLGALTVLSRKHYIINSLHVVTGACVLVTSLVLTLRAHRARFAASESLGPTPRGAPAAVAPARPRRRRGGSARVKAGAPRPPARHGGRRPRAPRRRHARRLRHADQAAAEPARPADDARRPVSGGAGRRAARRCWCTRWSDGAGRRRRRGAEPGVGAPHRRADAAHAQAAAARRPAGRRRRARGSACAVGGRPRRAARCGANATAAAVAARHAGSATSSSTRRSRRARRWPRWSARCPARCRR